MTTETDSEKSGALSPHEAFDIVGDETRLQILQTLGNAGGPLEFSELFDRVDYKDPSNFNYHLKKLRGHFVVKTDEGYTLQRAGSRIVEAILSGAVTEAPVLERTPVDTPCFLCGGQMEVRYHQETVEIYCLDCGGTRGESSATVGRSHGSGSDIVGGVPLPPAGVHDRSPTELLQAAEIWAVAHGQAAARGVCPRCSAPIERSVSVCEDHDDSGGRCQRCNQQFGVTTRVNCTNCILESESVFTSYLLGNTDVMAFLIEHGIDPIRPNAVHLTEFDETILSVEPFEARFAITVDDETLVLTVDEDLSVVDVTRRQASEPV